MTSRRKLRLLGLLVACGLVVLFVTQTILAQPGPPPAIPARFYGTVTLNGTSAPAGAIITAGHGGVVYDQKRAYIQDGVSHYVLDVPESNQAPGGTTGEMLEFRVNGVLAAQQATWVSGKNEELNLTAAGPVPTIPAPSLFVPLVER